jgi:hypothetical protein
MSARLAGVIWRRRAALGVFGVWALVSVARLTRLVEPPEARPGQSVAAQLEFFRANIPSDAGFLYVVPREFAQGSDTGEAPRLRYELYPRPYDKVRASQDESSVRQLMQTEGLRFIVVPDASQYAATLWLRQPRDWLRRIDFDATSYLLELVA